jgi:hypothetical protein
MALDDVVTGSICRPGDVLPDEAGQLKRYRVAPRRTRHR